MSHLPMDLQVIYQHVDNIPLPKHIPRIRKECFHVYLSIKKILIFTFKLLCRIRNMKFHFQLTVHNKIVIIDGKLQNERLRDY
jgi:hypothetical protein